MSIANNIKRLREEHGLTQRELGAIVGVSDKAVSTWELGLKEPRMGKLSRLAAHFGLPASALLDDVPATAFSASLDRLCAAWDRTPERVAEELSLPHARLAALRRGTERPTAEELDRLSAYFHVPHTAFTGETVPSEPANVRPVTVVAPAEHRRIPVLGRVPAGIPLEAVTDIVDEVELDSRLLESGYDYFGLLITGDSMFPEYREGDIVILRAQTTAETGDDVVAYIGGSDATFKRIAVLDDGIELRPVNPSYPVRRFSRQEVLSLPVTVGGIVVEQRRVRRR